jgi:hypothetical protein
MAISDSRRWIDVPNRSVAPSEDSRRPASGAVTNALNGPVICGYAGQRGCPDIGEDDALRALHVYVAG